MKELWVHCGAYKTGSSRIQNLAWGHRERLLEAGWLYPTSGIVEDEPDVGFRHSRLVYEHWVPQLWNQTVEQLVAEIAASPARGVLLSTEAWSRPGCSDSLVDLVARLREAGVVSSAQGGVRAVVYLRNRFDYARAFYREFTRRRSNRLDFPDFVDASRRPLDPLEAVTSLRAAVPELRVVPYEEAGDVARHFFGLLGIATPDDADVRVNPGLDAVSVEGMRQLNLVAPELTGSWPGTQLYPADQRAHYAEQPRPGQLDVDEAWVARFVEASRWSAEQVRRLVAPTRADAPDPATLAGPLHGEILAWLDRDTVPTVEVEVYPHPAVEEFVVKDVDPSQSKPWITGFLLLRPGRCLGADGWRLLAVDDYNEREISVDRPSPTFAKRHPDRAEATTARWGTTHVGYGLHGRVDIHLVHADGERCVLATLRRRWRIA